SNTTLFQVSRPRVRYFSSSNLLLTISIHLSLFIMPVLYSSTQQFTGYFKSNGRKSRCAMVSYAHRYVSALTEARIQRPVSEEDGFPSSSALNENSTLLRETTMHALIQACRLLVRRVIKDQKMWRLNHEGDVVVYPRRSLHDSDGHTSTLHPDHKHNSSPSFDEESISNFRFSFTMPVPPTSGSSDETESDGSTEIKGTSHDSSSEDSSNEQTVWRKFNVLSFVPDLSSDYCSN
ncbi:uncharacterized protein EV420DRAFT_1714725, partial [Desarmillaria tabescens]